MLLATGRWSLSPEYVFALTCQSFLWTILLNGLSPLFAYAFVYKTSVGWRGCFYLLIALNSIAALCWIFFYHPPVSAQQQRTERETNAC